MLHMRVQFYSQTLPAALPQNIVSGPAPYLLPRQTLVVLACNFECHTDSYGDHATLIIFVLI